MIVLVADACRVRAYLKSLLLVVSPHHFAFPVGVMGANHSQPKDHKEKAKRSPSLPTLLGKTSSRLNLLGLGKRSPQPPATPVTPQAVTVLELTAERDVASPEASADDSEDRPEVAGEASLFPHFIRHAA